MAEQSVRIVTDSTCDLPAEVVAELGITVVPLNIHFGSEVYRDCVDLTREEFVARLVRAPMLPTTSQPAVGLFEETYRRLAPVPVLSLHIAANLSGTYNSARLAAENGKAEARVVVLDSQSCTMGLGLLVVLAARAAKEGASLDTIVRLVEERIDRVRLLALLDTLEFLRRGGRIGRTAAFLGTLLSIKPIVHVVDGQVLPLEKVRTRARGLQRLVELAAETAPYEELAVAHVDSLAVANEVRAALRPIHPPERVLVVHGGSVIATHAGPGAIGIMGVRTQP